jgi:hypothetical protein
MVLAGELRKIYYADKNYEQEIWIFNYFLVNS